MSLSEVGLDASMIAAIHEMLDFEETDRPRQPSRTFVRDNKAIRATTADIMEFPNAFVFIVDMPGVKPENIQVQVEDGNVLTVSGERRRDKDREHKEGVKYVKMERRQGKFLKRFELPENANTDAISAHYQDGVLTIVVEKPPPEAKKPKIIEVKVSSGQAELPVEAAKEQPSQETEGARPGGTAESHVNTGQE
ncbi:hypothetical protein U1Q18_002968 [Sarracenia purpurea var. burkii]